MKKILFVAYGGGHINIIDLIGEKLLDEPHMEFTILALTTAYNKVVDKYPKGIVKKVSDYIHLFDSELTSIKTYGQELLAKNYNESSGISKEDTMIYLGCSMHDLVHKYGEKEAKELYSLKKRQAFLPVDTMKKIIQYEQCDIVVSTTSPRFEQASFIAANQLGIITVEILDLFGELYPLPEARHIVCMNKDVEESLRKRGLNDRVYYHFGQPSIEATGKRVNGINPFQIKSKLQLKNSPTLLFATQQPMIYNSDYSYAGCIGYDTINNFIFNLFNGLHQKYDLNILLRIHPNEDIKNYQKYLDKYPFVHYVNDILNLEESLAASEILVAQTSTVCLEAIASHKPVFTFQTHLDKTYTMPRYKYEPFIFSDGFEELKNNLSTYLSNPYKIKEEDFLPKNSVENIIKLLKDL